MQCCLSVAFRDCLGCGCSCRAVHRLFYIVNDVFSRVDFSGGWGRRCWDDGRWFSSMVVIGDICNVCKNYLEDSWQFNLLRQICWSVFIFQTLLTGLSVAVVVVVYAAEHWRNKLYRRTQDFTMEGVHRRDDGWYRVWQFSKRGQARGPGAQKSLRSWSKNVKLYTIFNVSCRKFRIIWLYEKSLDSILCKHTFKNSENSMEVEPP